MNKIDKSFHLLVQFLTRYATYDIGSLHEISRTLYGEASFNNYTYISENLVKSLQSVSTELEQNASLRGKRIELYTLIVIDSLLFNLYSRHRNARKQEMQRSVYGSSVQSFTSSQLRQSGEDDQQQRSVNFGRSAGGGGGGAGAGGGGGGAQFAAPAQQSDLQAQGGLHMQHFTTLIDRLLREKSFYERLVQLIGQARLTQDIKLHLTLLKDTLEYILNKEDMYKTRAVFVEHAKILEPFLLQREKRPFAQEVEEVNRVLFSAQLDKIYKLLAVSEELGFLKQKEIHFAVSRIYFAAHSRKRSNFLRKSFKNIKYVGRDMLHNLFKYYINYDPSRPKTQLFGQYQINNPLFQFLQNHLQLLFMPLFNAFSDLFDKQFMMQFCDDATEFYEKVESAVRDSLIPFINDLPAEFTNIFSELYELITHSTAFKDAVGASQPLKQLFSNRFFLNPDLKALVNPNVASNNTFERTANYVNYLFYKKKEYQGNKKYGELSALVTQAFEDLVRHYDLSETQDVHSFFVTDPQLRADYLFLYDIIKILTFSPHEEKSFDMEIFHPRLPTRTRIKNNASEGVPLKVLPSEQVQYLTQQNQRTVAAFNQQQMRKNSQNEVPVATAQATAVVVANKQQQEVINIGIKESNTALQVTNEMLQRDFSKASLMQEMQQTAAQTQRTVYQSTDNLQQMLPQQQYKKEVDQNEQQKQPVSTTNNVLLAPNLPKSSSLNFTSNALAVSARNVTPQPRSQSSDLQSLLSPNIAQPSPQNNNTDFLEPKMNATARAMSSVNSSLPLAEQQRLVQVMEENNRLQQELAAQRRKILDERELMMRERREKIMMEDEKYHLQRQISELEDRNSFLLDSMRARYPELAVATPASGTHYGATLQANLQAPEAREYADLPAWRAQKQLAEDQQSAPETVANSEKHLRQKRLDEFSVIHNSLRSKQLEIEQANVQIALHEKFRIHLLQGSAH